MRLLRFLFPTVLGLLPLAAGAQLPGLPSDARLVSEEVLPLARTNLPTGPWMQDGLDVVVANGWTRRQAWQIAVSGLSTAQLMAPLRQGLEADGFQVLFRCRSRECGGFEFRYAMDLLPEPAMHVDLGDFRYLLVARNTGPETEYVALLASRSLGRAFLHVTEVGATEMSAGPVAESGDAASGATGGSKLPRPMPREAFEAGGVDWPDAQLGPVTAGVTRELERAGRAVLADLSFESGSSQLADTPFSSLSELADWMNRHPEARIVLVGHTDNEGSLAANVALSRKRAEAVLERLRRVHGVAAGRMEADGVGYLAPLASNATESGRTLNRRVEVVLAGSE